MRLFIAPPAVAVALVLILAGCAPGQESGNKLDPMKSPLSEYYASLYGSGDQKDYAKQQKKVEELVAKCMAKEGFDYIPVDQSQNISYGSDEGVDRNTKKWVAENGYGMTTQNDSQPTPDPEQEPYVDPNQPYVESLSATEQAAFYETLYGVSPTEEEMASEDFVYSWENGGCQGAAQHEVQPQPSDNEKYKALLEKMNTIYEKVQSDPVIAKLDATWSSCMADAGYSSYSKKQDAINAVVEESNKLYDSETGEPPADDELKRVQKLEIDTAVADFACSEKIDYQDKSLAVQFALEKQFIADNKAELDAMVAEYEQAG
ncbi:hypothetical protein [Salinibacterium sp.]|uniref:hypothetical protein n=1 Tax=Salinibacterium sp. TaxID=1915057 RepID=UPI00286B1D64|nr:hypothetical protein [Salinibacterium sp.]